MKTAADYSNLDRQIADLLGCKPLPEAEVKALCEKVPVMVFRLRRY
jgi:hypothetical protein